MVVAGREMSDIVRDILVVLKKHGLVCSRYAPPHMPSVQCRARVWNGPRVILITIQVDSGGPDG